MAGNKLDRQYKKLLKKIIKKGVPKEDRTGTGTLSIFDYNLSVNMSDGFPLLTTKKMFTRGIIEELLWFLRGETNIQNLVKEDVNIWVGDAYKRYKSKVIVSSNPNDRNIIKEKNGEYTIGSDFTESEFIEKIKTDDAFAQRWGDLGKIYGHAWRNWNGEIDQISKLITDLVKNPDSRRLIVNAWNASDIESVVLPPCHFGFQCYTRLLTPKERADWYWENYYETGMDYYQLVEDFKNNPDKDFLTVDYNAVPKRALSLKWYQRSADILGIPFNISSYGFLLHMLAKITNMIPDVLSGTLGDTHIYNNQFDGVEEQLQRKNIYKLPSLVLNGEFNNIKKYWSGDTFQIDKFLLNITPKDFEIKNYESYPKIYIPLSN